MAIATSYSASSTSPANEACPSPASSSGTGSSRTQAGDPNWPERATNWRTTPSRTRTWPPSTASKLTAEINWCRDVLTRFAGGPGRYFRPSGVDEGAASPSDLVLKAAGASGYSTVIGFGVDPRDDQDPGSALVIARTLDRTRPGSIISLHLGHPDTLDALPKILDGVAAQNLRPVTISQLLEVS